MPILVTSTGVSHEVQVLHMQPFALLPHLMQSKPGNKRPALHFLQVAQLYVQGINNGRYIPCSPDSGADFLVSSCLTPCGPPPHNLLIDMMMSPLYVLLHWLVKRKVESATKQILNSQLQAADIGSFRSLLLASMVVAVPVAASMYYWEPLSH